MKRNVGGGREPGRAEGEPLSGSRRALVLLFTLTFVGLGAGAALSFNKLVLSLTETPAPSSQAFMPAGLEGGELVLDSARRLMRAQDFQGALRLLDTIPPSELAYPMARDLRAQAEAALAEGKR